LSPLHHAPTLLDLFNDLSRSERRIPDADAYASLAKLALQLGDPNCTAAFVPDKNIMMPNDGTAEQGLRLLCLCGGSSHHDGDGTACVRTAGDACCFRRSNRCTAVELVWTVSVTRYLFG
jgi:hypothetical protein